MPFIPVILWTDALIYLLLALVVLFAWYVRGRPHLAAPWKRVAQSRSGMVAATVLAAYLVVGLFDSIHFRLPLEGNGAKRVYSVEALSVLDVLVTPLRSRVEKTYSAPLAAYSFAKETVQLPDGKEIREFPRLKYGGANLRDPAQQRFADITRRVFYSLMLAALAWIVIAAMVVRLAAMRRQGNFRGTAIALWRGESEIPWNAILTTLGVLMLCTFPVAILSEHYHVFGTDKVGQDVLYL
ncbi:MAG TPA: ABC transporter permease, partial [Burkholderiales bacterium]|nr:ABC transporter permease [Burkholderiales bacterium]